MCVVHYAAMVLKLLNIYSVLIGWHRESGTSVRGGSGMCQLDMKVSSVIFRASVF